MMIAAEHYALTGNVGQGMLLVWTNINPGDECEPISYPQFPKKTVTIQAAPQELGVEGRNLTTGPWYPVRDDETCAVITAPGLYAIHENPAWLRPSAVTTGPVTVAIVATH